MKLDRTELALIVGTLVVLALPLFIPVGRADQLIFGISRATAVLGLLLLWRCGLISFGHALYFGLGGYTVAILSRTIGVSDLLLRMLGAIVVTGLLAFVLGFILRRYRGIFFAMLSLAFSMVLYGALVKSEWLGSTDGFSVAAPTFLGIQLGSYTRVSLFAAATLLFAFTAFSVHRFHRSIVGSVSEAIRDNEIRVGYLGFSVARTIHLNYVLSAMLAGAGGAMMAMAVGQVDPDSMVNWTASGELLFIAILSGHGSVLAPVIGAVLFESLKTFALEVAPQGWNFIVGATLLVMIFVLPDGLWSLVRRASPLLRRVRP